MCSGQPSQHLGSHHRIHPNEGPQESRARRPGAELRTAGSRLRLGCSFPAPDPAGAFCSPLFASLRLFVSSPYSFTFPVSGRAAGGFAGRLCGLFSLRVSAGATRRLREPRVGAAARRQRGAHRSALLLPPRDCRVLQLCDLLMSGNISRPPVSGHE